MEKIWENPVTKIVLAAGVLIAAFFIGKTEAFKSLFAAAPTSPKPADGTACLTKDTVPLPGTYKNGTCVATPDHAGNSGGSGGSGGSGNDVQNARTSGTTQQRMAQLRTIGISDNVMKSNLACKKWIEAASNDPNLHNYWMQCTSGVKTSNAPATIQVWVGAAVPYSYMGCTYGHPYYTTFQGQRVKVLSKISCP